MTPREFCYWLQGFFELSGSLNLTVAQSEVVKNHLNLVFKHSIDGPDPTGELQALHDGKVHDIAVEAAHLLKENIKADAGVSAEYMKKAQADAEKALKEVAKLADRVRWDGRARC